MIATPPTFYRRPGGNCRRLCCSFAIVNNDGLVLRAVLKKPTCGGAIPLIIAAGFVRSIRGGPTKLKLASNSVDH